MKIDYSSLKDDFTNISPEDYKKAKDSLQRKLNELHNHLVKIQAPNMKVNFSYF